MEQRDAQLASSDLVLKNELAEKLILNKLNINRRNRQVEQLPQATTRERGLEPPIMWLGNDVQAIFTLMEIMLTLRAMRNTK